MSRFDGWLVRYIMMQDTQARVSVTEAAKCACVRAAKFADALRDPRLVALDAKHLGIAPEDLRAVREWMESMEAEKAVAESMVASAAARTQPKPPSEKYRGGWTRLGTWRPNPGSAHRDALNIPINPIRHPEPEGEWHAGLNEAGHKR